MLIWIALDKEITMRIPQTLALRSFKGKVAQL